MNLIPPFILRRIAHRPGLVKIVDNISWLFLDKLLRMGVGLFVGVWVARYLGPEQFGQLSFATAFVGLFGAIATLGLKGIVVRDIVRDPESARLTLGTAAVLQLIGGLLSYLLILGAIAYLRPDDALARSIVAILGAMMLLKAGQIAVYWFESQVQSKYTVWVQNGVFLVFAAIKVGLILQQAPLIAFVWAMLAEAVVVALILLIVMGWRGPALRSLRLSVERGVTLLSDSWPLILSGMSILLYMKIDQVMLGEMVGLESVGIYSAAARISEVWYFIAVAINSSIRPSLIQLRERSITMFHARLQKVFSLMVLLSFCIALIVTFSGSQIILLLYGGEYYDSVDVLRIHIWAGVFVFLNNAVWAWYIVENKQNLANRRLIVGLILNFVLNYIMIPIYGVVGAAIATLISRAFVAYFGQLLSAETRHLFKLMSVSIFTVGLAKLNISRQVEL